MPTFETQQPGGRARASFINSITDEVTALRALHNPGWSTFTPALTAATTAPNLGSTGSAVGRWWWHGAFVFTEIALTFGGTGVAAGSGAYRLSLPTPPNPADRAIGSLYLAHPGTSAVQAGVCRVNGGVLELIGPTALVTHAAPWTWAAGDSITASIAYNPA
ncbi:hypothetical protein Lfu02_80210 [Longispora fulva]|uniref:Uncharacterized protein n=1 Tax=Longispora fulva TaxID=619741 RepID=A0A8J7KNW2_9ACTN|nr:hypothetical protein [Longispora fulva]MBG6140691.1 hypothetical protein [Longispora fulva]GIG63649.1 hypothetical protein Lfu02_80210 [Longispora fulva]